MKKILLLITLILSTVTQAADTELQDMVEMTAIVAADALYVVDDPLGAPASRFITALNLFDMIDTFAELQAITADMTLVNEEAAWTFDDIITFSTAITLSDAATIDQSANNYIDFTENADILQFYFDATDLSIVWSDGALTLRNDEDVDGIVNISGKDAGDKGVLRVRSDGDDKYIELHNDDTDAVITNSAGNIIINPVGLGIVIGDNGDEDYTITFDGDTSNGVLTYDEDNADFEFGQDIATTGDILISGGNINTGAVALVVGDAATTSIQLLTDGTGDGEIALPNDAIGDAEINWATCTLADFDFETAWKMFHSDAAGDVIEITLGANGTFLESNGAAANPAFRALVDGDVPDNITIDLATLATTVTLANDNATNDNQDIIFTADAAGPVNLEADTGDFYYNPSTGTVTATEFAGGGAGVTGVDAATGDSATAFFDAGTIEHEWGGLQANLAAYTGLIGITGADTTVEVDTSAEMLTAITDETGTGKLTFATAPVFVTSIQLTGADANPAAAAGTIAYDNTIAVMSGGGIRWYDNDSVRLIVDLETDPSVDDHVVTYDAAADGFYMSAAGTGDMTRAVYDAGLSGGVDQITTVDSTYASDLVLLTGTAVGTDAPKTDAALTYDATTGTLSATQFVGGGLGGFTAWDDITDPDLAATIDFVTFTQTIDIGVTDAGGPKSGLILDVTGLGAGDTDVIALEITTATDDDPDFIPIAVYDDSGVANDLLFQVNYRGEITLMNGAEISNYANNYFSFLENGDYLSLYFDGTDGAITWSDGALNLRNDEDGVDAIVNIQGKDVNEKGILRVDSDGDDKHIELHHDDTDGHIITNSGDIHIEPTGGDVSLAASNLDTTGDVDFGGADLELPQASPAVPGVDGGVELDFTDGKMVIQHGAAHAELGGATDVVMGTLIQSWSGTIYEPDGVNDVLTVKAINSIEFPHGVVITAVYLGVSEDSDYTLVVQNFDDFDTINGANPTIDTVAYSNDTTGEIIDTTPTYDDIAAGQIIMISIPATDVDWIHFEIYYYEPAA